MNEAEVKSTKVQAGLIPLKNSKWAWPIFSQLLISVTYMRVRTTSFRVASTACKAVWIFFIIWIACVYGLPIPIILPALSVAVVPETWI